MTPNKNLKIYFENFRADLVKFLRSTDFSKAVVLSFSMASCILVFLKLDLLGIGTAMAAGSLMSSPGDITGSLKHKVVGGFSAAFLAGISTIIAGYASMNIWILIPVLTVLIFGISYLAVYGFRASLVAFSGLFAIVLSFASVSSSIEIWQRGLLIFFGGSWYLLLSLGWFFISRRRPTEQMIAQTMQLTAIYLQKRLDMLTASQSREELQKKLFSLQTELNDKHEGLRELLINSRRASGGSNFFRKRLIVFVELVDILELAMANPVNYERIDDLEPDEKKQMLMLIDFSRKMSEQLHKIASSLEQNSGMPENDLLSSWKNTSRKFDEYKGKVDISEKRETLLLFRNILDYQEKLWHKLNNIDRVLNNLEKNNRLRLKSKEVSKFLTPQDYSLDILIRNFNFGSPVFRHALRISLVMLVGFSIGYYFSIQNAYWILLTIIVIMRPNYGLTKQRTRQRIVGTLIGAVVAVGIVFLTQNKTVYGILALFSLTVAFSMIQRNYRTAAIFITLSIIFIYSLLQPDILNVIEYRIIDTLVGAGLAALGNYILWPTWEALGIREVIGASIKANNEFLAEIDRFYHSKGKLPTSYKLARKKAFMEMGNLSAAFQRMTQEPKSKQKEIGLIFEIVSLNQTFLSALASLGAYVRNHVTTPASAGYETLVKAIKRNLKNSENATLNQKPGKTSDKRRVEAATESLHGEYQNLVKQRNEEIRSGKHEIGSEMRLRLQEAQLITGQLEWLLDISENLQESLDKLKSASTNE